MDILETKTQVIILPFFHELLYGTMHREYGSKLNKEILQKAKEIMILNIRKKDALHLACVIHAKAAYFIATDKKC